MKKADWLKVASKLCKELGERGSVQVSASEAKSYSAVRSVIMADSHHPPKNATGDGLLKDAQGWMTAVKKGTYDKKFED